ncbi:hypothetical protein BH10PSE17_BH10PSE17_22610 [soil metagenome]
MSDPDKPDDKPEDTHPDPLSGADKPAKEVSSDPIGSIIAYPLEFPIKIMGKRVDSFAQTVTQIVKQHAPDWDPSTIEMRSSRENTYLSVTVTINATSREQLDALYTALSSHPMVSYVL